MNRDELKIMEIYSESEKFEKIHRDSMFTFEISKKS